MQNHQQIGFGRRTRRMLAGIVAIGALAVPAAASAVEGDVTFLRNATTSFDETLNEAGPAEVRWMQDHYDRFRAYPPFFDRFLEWAPETDFYIDAYAIYNSEADDGFPDRRLLRSNPDWVLKDSAGRNLYIPYGCGGGTCPQYAADFGNPAYQQFFFGIVRKQLAKGYSGIHVDDVNLEMRVGNGNGDPVRPIDPRTGSPMTDANWNRYMADFMVNLRNEFPGVDISHNSLWFAERDGSVERQTDAADYIEMERGFNDGGIGYGSDRFGFESYLGHVDWLHSRGSKVVLEPYDLTPKSANFEVASYLLVKEEGDMITSDYHSTPTDWWSGWDVSLGAATGGRYEWKGLIRRDFARGIVLVNQPDAEAATVSVDGSWTDLDGKALSGTVNLGPREGVVLQGAGALSATDGGRISLNPSKRKVKRGSRLQVAGKGGVAGERVTLQRKAKGGWRTLSTPVASENGSFKTRFSASQGGRMRLRAVTSDERSSRIVLIKVV